MPTIKIPERSWETFKEFLDLALFTILKEDNNSGFSKEEKKVVEIVKQIVNESKRYVTKDQ